VRVEGFYNRHAETMGRDELERLKLERLKWTVRHAYENVRFYREAMREKGIAPDDIKTPDDLRKLGIEYQITLTREKGLDVMKLTVELATPDVPRLRGRAGGEDKA
jgi:phenylacetate-coenzyme A ligase PaaK-like adenylate-forming protein